MAPASRRSFRLAPWLLLSLLCALNGCFVGMYFPSTIDVEFVNPSPPAPSAGQVRTLAIVPPSLLEAVFGQADSSRGKLDNVALDLAERMKQSGRFVVVSPAQLQAALTGARPEPDAKRGASLTDTEQRHTLLRAARTVRADGLLLLGGQWESASNLGNVAFGRPEFSRQLTLSLLGATSGELLWRQDAKVIVHEGIATPQESDVRSVMAERLAEQFLQTIK